MHPLYTTPTSASPHPQHPHQRPHAVALCITAMAMPLLVHVSANAQAQAPVIRPDAGSVLQQQNNQPTPQPLAVPRVLPPTVTTPKPVLQALPSASVAVSGFTFSGNTVFSTAQLVPLVSALAGKTATLDELNTAADAVRQFYRVRGYLLAQAYLPRQDVTGGSIEITVLEGTLGRVTTTAAAATTASSDLASGQTRLRPSFAQGMLDAALPPGQVVTEDALERPLLLLSDLPGVAAQSSVGAGTAVGTADIDVTLGQNAALVTGSVDTDNQGSRFNGATRAGASLNVNNATGYGDLLTVRAQLSVENTRSNFARVGWQVPVGYHGTQVGVAFAKINYALIGSFAALGAEGDARVTSIYLTHPLVRSRNLNLSLLAGYDKKDTEDRTLSVSNVETRHIDISRLGLRGNLADNLLGGGLSSFNLAMSGGKLRIDQLAAQATDQAGAQASGKFSKTNLELSRLQTLSDGLNVLASLNAQWASKNLSSAEKMTLGGPNDVRAYPVGEASGDQGYVGSVEARYSPPNWAWGGTSTTLSVFYDFGQVTISKTPLAGVAGSANKRAISGAGVGLTLGRGGDFLVRAALAWRTSGEKPLSDSDRAPRLWLQASKSF